MRRGFLNSKKAVHAPLKAEPAVVSPPSPLSAPAGSGTPKKPTESKFNDVIIRDDISANSRASEPYSVIRIPSLTLTKSSSTCIIRLSTCKTIMNTPGFYTPPPPIDPNNRVFTKNAPDMGIGLFAKRSVPLNRVVFLERPVLILPRGLPHNLEGLSKEEGIKRHYSAFESMLQQALSVMTKEDADTYMSLSNCLPECPQLYGIARTNGFDTGTDIEEEISEDGKFGYAAIGRLASRINHSCVPNVRVDIDIPTFSLRVIAERDIKAGDQLFYSYCEHNRSAEERQRQLGRYRFVCQCQACVNATPESDKIREEVADRIQEVIDGAEEMLANPQFSIRSLDPLLRLEEEIVKEGMDFGKRFVFLLRIISKAYGSLNIIAKEMEYFNKWNKYICG